MSNRQGKTLGIGILGALALAAILSISLGTGVLVAVATIGVGAFVGYVAGKKDGNKQGYAEAKSEDDFSRGYNQGDKLGFERGKSSFNGRDYDKGYEQGFDTGHSAGVEDGSVTFVEVVTVTVVNIVNIVTIIFGNPEVEAEAEAYAEGRVDGLMSGMRLMLEDDPDPVTSGRNFQQKYLDAPDNIPDTAPSNEKYPNTTFGALSPVGMYYPPAIGLSERAGDGNDWVASRLFGIGGDRLSGDLETDGCDNAACTCNNDLGGFGKQF